MCTWRQVSCILATTRIPPCVLNYVRCILHILSRVRHLHTYEVRGLLDRGGGGRSVCVNMVVLSPLVSTTRLSPRVPHKTERSCFAACTRFGVVQRSSGGGLSNVRNGQRYRCHPWRARRGALHVFCFSYCIHFRMYNVNIFFTRFGESHTRLRSRDE